MLIANGLRDRHASLATHLERCLITDATISFLVPSRRTMIHGSCATVGFRTIRPSRRSFATRKCAARGGLNDLPKWIVMTGLAAALAYGCDKAAPAGQMSPTAVLRKKVGRQSRSPTRP